jgi:hypothetical protein
VTPAVVPLVVPAPVPARVPAVAADARVEVPVAQPGVVPPVAPLRVVLVALVRVPAGVVVIPARVEGVVPVLPDRPDVGLHRMVDRCGGGRGDRREPRQRPDDDGRTDQRRLHSR